MRLLIQRVRRASVAIGGDAPLAGSGRDCWCCSASGATTRDEDIELPGGQSSSRLRIFDDEAGVMNLDVRADTRAKLLVVSQFTLHGLDAQGQPAVLYQGGPGRSLRTPDVRTVSARRSRAACGRRGRARANSAPTWQVELVNDGPVWRSGWIQKTRSETYLYQDEDAFT